MPVSFKPDDSRERKKEAQEPKMPKTVDEQVKEIADKYYAEKKKRKQVDNWGQPLHKLDEEKIRRELEKARQEARTKFGEEKGKSIRGRLSDAMGRGSSSSGPRESKQSENKKESKDGKGLQPQREQKKDNPHSDLKDSQARSSHHVSRDTTRRPQTDAEDEKSIPDDAGGLRNEQRAKRPSVDSQESPLRKRFASLIGATADTERERGAIRDGKMRLEGETDSKKDSEREIGAKAGVKDAQKKAKIPDTQESTGRLGPKNNLRYGEVNGEQVKTPERLKELLDGEYEGLKSRKDFSKLQEEALAHMEMVKRYEGMERIPHGEASRVAKDLGRNPETVRQWTKGENAGLYRFMEYATPKSEAAEKVRQLLEKNNGVRSPEDVRARYDNYYFGEAERNSRFFKREEDRMERYFRFLERYQRGGVFLDIVRDANIPESSAQEYLKGAKPWQVSIAAQIPAEIPREGHKWLPTVGGTNAVRDDWVEVPEKVTDWKQVKEMLNRLEPLDNEDMRKLERRFGGNSRDENFMYLLGATVSDSSVPSSSTSALSMGMNLSKGYEWSKDFGDATCYYLGQIGIRAGRVKDAPAAVAEIETKSGIKEIHGKEQYKWMSENSPVLKWMRQACLGYDDTAKTYQSTDSGWILNSSEGLRKAFLQGMSDGDGGVSKTGYYFSISTHSDHELVEGLLNSLGIGTYRSRTYVRTDGKESLKKVAEIQPFRHASSRISDLNKAVDMIDSRRHEIKSKPPSDDEMEFMVELRNKGLSYPKIGEELYDRFGYSLDPRSIWHIITDWKKKSERGS